jgi:malate synthase A
MSHSDRFATPDGVQVRGPHRPGFDEILTTDALSFVADLVRTYRPRVGELLERRRAAQARWDAGERPSFLPETREIRQSDWTVAPIPDDLRDRRVEITGPVDRKMIINALNSDANVFMADFEDSNAPTWDNVIGGQINLRDAASGTMRFEDPSSGKKYELGDSPATLLVRPRGWHLVEKHILVDGEPATAGLVDFGLYFFHNARRLVDRGTGPYFYLPKLQSHLEARVWNEAFVQAQERFGLPRGTIRATVLIETIPAVFEMDEILWELRDHSSGLNCGRWDYIFSFIKVHRNDPNAVIPDRGQVTMEQPFMRAYTQLLTRVCHRREIHAMGGMAAQIPIKVDKAANDAAIAKVKADKLREVRDGHDGTWVAHPGLVAVARQVFDEHMQGANQIDRKREDFDLDEEQLAVELLRVPEGTRTEEALRHNVRVGVQYLEAWLGGNGCVPLYYLMEDAATAEISRTQVWQWIRHGATLDNGERVTPEYFRRVLDEELERIRGEVGDERFRSGRYPQARDLFEQVSVAEDFPEFLTLPAYEQILTLEEA